MNREYLVVSEVMKSTWVRLVLLDLVCSVCVVIAYNVVLKSYLKWIDGHDVKQALLYDVVITVQNIVSSYWIVFLIVNSVAAFLLIEFIQNTKFKYKIIASLYAVGLIVVSILVPVFMVSSLNLVQKG